jgi:LytS/YehU family sensor histidine kinase
MGIRMDMAIVAIRDVIVKICGLIGKVPSELGCLVLVGLLFFVFGNIDRISCSVSACVDW